MRDHKKTPELRAAATAVETAKQHNLMLARMAKMRGHHRKGHAPVEGKSSIGGPGGDVKTPTATAPTDGQATAAAPTGEQPTAAAPAGEQPAGAAPNSDQFDAQAQGSSTEAQGGSALPQGSEAGEQPTGDGQAQASPTAVQGEGALPQASIEGAHELSAAGLETSTEAMLGMFAKMQNPSSAGTGEEHLQAVHDELAAMIAKEQQLLETLQAKLPLEADPAKREQMMQQINQLQQSIADLQKKLAALEAKMGGEKKDGGTTSADTDSTASTGTDAPALGSLSGASSMTAPGHGTDDK